jgi:hypothetical protein
MADVLETAADHIRLGWTQGRPFEHVNGQRYVCANGAMWLACGLTELDGSAEVMVAPVSYLDLFLQTSKTVSNFVGQDSAGWNDTIGQTQAVVADTMLRLAKELRTHEPS